MARSSRSRGLEQHHHHTSPALLAYVLLGILVGVVLTLAIQFASHGMAPKPTRTTKTSARIVSSMTRKHVKDERESAPVAMMGESTTSAEVRAVTRPNVLQTTGGTTQVALPRPIPPIKSRGEIPQLLENEGMRTGVEVGVLRGHFSRWMLKVWKSCESYTLVDLWAHQENYKDIANGDDGKFNVIMQEAKKSVAGFPAAKLLQKDSLAAAADFEDESLDFVYIDARHDYDVRFPFPASLSLSLSLCVCVCVCVSFHDRCGLVVHPSMCTRIHETKRSSS